MTGDKSKRYRLRRAAAGSSGSRWTRTVEGVGIVLELCLVKHRGSQHKDVDR